MSGFFVEDLLVLSSPQWPAGFTLRAFLLPPVACESQVPPIKGVGGLGTSPPLAKLHFLQRRRSRIFIVASRHRRPPPAAPPTLDITHSTSHTPTSHTEHQTPNITALQQSPLHTANRNSRDMQRRAGDPRRQSWQALQQSPSTLQIRIAETCKGEPATQGVNRGKRYSRPPSTLQITIAETRKEEPATQGVNGGKRYSRASYRLQSR